MCGLQGERETGVPTRSPKFCAYRCSMLTPPADAKAAARAARGLDQLDPETDGPLDLPFTIPLPASYDAFAKLVCVWDELADSLSRLRGLFLCITVLTLVLSLYLVG